VRHEVQGAAGACASTCWGPDRHQAVVLENLFVGSLGPWRPRCAAARAAFQSQNDECPTSKLPRRSAGGDGRSTTNMLNHQPQPKAARTPPAHQPVGLGSRPAQRRGVERGPDRRAFDLSADVLCDRGCRTEIVSSVAPVGLFFERARARGMYPGDPMAHQRINLPPRRIRQTALVLRRGIPTVSTSNSPSAERRAKRRLPCRPARPSLLSPHCAPPASPGREPRRKVARDPHTPMVGNTARMHSLIGTVGETKRPKGPPKMPRPIRWNPNSTTAVEVSTIREG
jgi:hypothetical protein